MKAIFVLYATTSLLFAEDSINLLTLEKESVEQALPKAPSEELAKQEIESFFKEEPKLDEIEVATPAVVMTPEVQLQVPSPQVKEPALDVPMIAAKEEQKIPLATSSEDVNMAELEAEVNGPEPKMSGVMIDLQQVFAGSPTIYTVLLLLSVGSFGVWLYTLLSLRTTEILPEEAIAELREQLLQNHYDEALSLCRQNKSILFKMIATGIETRDHGKTTMVDMMHTEGRRASSNFWQRLALLNDVAIIAPMLGLLGTVLGMFYAFYDLNRSMESVAALFDGLGISVGTTVCGLVVAILALMFHSITKYRLV